MEIEWRPVPGFEGLYEVSNDGQVKSLTRPVAARRDGSRVRIMPGRIRKARVVGVPGYLSLYLSKDGKPYKFLVHRLVAMVFHAESYFPGAKALHNDGNRFNNRAENLRWGTIAENSQDMIRHGSCVNSNKTHCPKGHPYSPENTYVQKGRKFSPTRKCRICTLTSQRRRYRERKSRAA